MRLRRLSIRQEVNDGHLSIGVLELAFHTEDGAFLKSLPTCKRPHASGLAYASTFQYA